MNDTNQPLTFKYPRLYRIGYVLGALQVGSLFLAFLLYRLTSINTYLIVGVWLIVLAYLCVLHIRFSKEETRLFVRLTTELVRGRLALDAVQSLANVIKDRDMKSEAEHHEHTTH